MEMLLGLYLFGAYFVFFTIGFLFGKNTREGVTFDEIPTVLLISILWPATFVLLLGEEIGKRFR